MATTTFVDNVTQTAADWFNDVDRLQYDILNDPADLAALVATLGATNWTITGNLSVQGNTTIGNASGDSLTFHPNAWTLSNAVTVTGTWANLGTVTTVDINGGTIDGAVIGGSSAAAGSFTTLSASGATNLDAGTVSAPGLYLEGETGTGLYRIGANNHGYAVSGAKVLDISSTGLAVTGALSCSTNLTVTGGTITTGSTTNNIILNTSDGADNGTLTINGGGAGSASTRGAYITVAGNEHASTGAINMVAGNVTGGEFNVFTADTKYLSLSRTGTLTLAGGTITTGSTTALSLATSGGTQVGIANTASAVNFLNLSGGATTNPPYVFVGGADTNIGLDLVTKGTGNFRFITGGYSDQQVSIAHTASANRYITLTGSNGGNPAISVSAGELAVGTNAWTFGVANSVSPTSPNRTLTVTIGGTTYYIAAKTTND